MKKLDRLYELVQIQERSISEIKSTIEGMLRSVKVDNRPVVFEENYCRINAPSQVTKVEFGMLLRNIRKAEGLTLKVISEKSGKSVASILMLEKGRAGSLMNNIITILDSIGYAIYVSIDNKDLPFKSLVDFKDRILTIVLSKKTTSVLAVEIGCTEAYLRLLKSKECNFGLEIFLKTIGCVGGTITIKPKESK